MKTGYNEAAAKGCSTLEKDLKLCKESGLTMSKSGWKRQLILKRYLPYISTTLTMCLKTGLDWMSDASVTAQGLT